MKFQVIEIAWLQTCSNSEDNAMTLDEIQAEISILLSQFDERPDDAHELYVQLHEKIRQLRAYGMPVPKDLAEFEKTLLAEFQAESQGR